MASRGGGLAGLGRLPTSYAGVPASVPALPPDSGFLLMQTLGGGRREAVVGAGFPLLTRGTSTELRAPVPAVTGIRRAGGCLKKKKLPKEVKVIPSVLQNSHGQLCRLCHAQDTCQGRDESCPHPEGAPAANLHKHLGG